MNDDPTLAALTRRLTETRDSLSDEHMTIPASEIIARDTKRRARQVAGDRGSFLRRRIRCGRQDAVCRGSRAIRDQRDTRPRPG